MKNVHANIPHCACAVRDVLPDGAAPAIARPHLDHVMSFQGYKVQVRVACSLDRVCSSRTEKEHPLK